MFPFSGTFSIILVLSSQAEPCLPFGFPEGSEPKVPVDILSLFQLSCRSTVLISHKEEETSEEKKQKGNSVKEGSLGFPCSFSSPGAFKKNCDAEKNGRL